MLRLRAHLWVGLLTLCCSAARADADAVSIDWRADGEPACTKPEDAEAQVARLSRASAVSSRFEVNCQTLAEGRQRCAVRVAGEAAQSERELASCAEARETAILIMAMALAPAAPAPEASETDAPPAPPPVNTAPESNAARWLLSLAALADYGTLPGANFGPSLGVSFAWQRWRFGVAARYLPPHSVSDLPPDVEAKVSWFAAALSPAWVWSVGAWGFGPRIELELGAQHGRASGVEQADPANAIWAAGAGGGQLEVWLHARVGLELVGLVGVPVRRPRFGFADDAPFYTATPYFVRGTLGLTFRLDAKD